MEGLVQEAMVQRDRGERGDRAAAWGSSPGRELLSIGRLEAAAAMPA